MVGPEAENRRMDNWQNGWLGRIVAWALLMVAMVSLSACATQQHFASPEGGVAALVDAVKADDQSKLGAILGPHADRLLSSGDSVADQQSRQAFIMAYGDANKLLIESDNHAVLVIGQDEWPLPIPLVRSPAGWQFDTLQGEQEILSRRIGRNELAAIQVCLAVVDAAHEYAELDVDGDGIPEYAPQFVSTAGKRDGLYWPTKANEPPSPLGPLLAAATSEGYTDSVSKPLAPYHGYFYRILTKQGNDAPGGARDYVIKDMMIGGFAVIAYPAEHGISGIMSFLVNQDGLVYEKNLGKNTAAIASGMTTFNPDASWRKVSVQGR